MSAFTQPSPTPVPQPVEPPPRPVPVPPPVQPKRRRRWLIPALIAGAGLVAGLLYLLSRPSQTTKLGSTDLVRTATAVTGPIKRVVRISGQSSARHYAGVLVPLFRGPDSTRDLTLMKVAKAGSFVKKGDLVAQLDAQNAQDHIDDTMDTVQQAENDVKKKEAEQEVEWESLQQQFRIAKADWDKALLDLKAAEVRTEIEREIYKLTAEEAEASFKQLQGDLARKRTADKAELRILQITATRQHMHLDRHVSDAKKFTIFAPMSGLVVMSQTFRSGEMRQIQEGDQVYPGQPFMKIVDLSSMQIEGTVSQADSGELRVGQACVVGLDAFPELRMRGQVLAMGALAVKGMWDTFYIRNVPVRVAIQGSDERLIPDLSAWAEVQLEEQENALTVPLDAVRYEGGQAVVWVKRGDRFERRPVELGIRSKTHVAVTSGLRAGEAVALETVKSP